MADDKKLMIENLKLRDVYPSPASGDSGHSGNLARFAWELKRMYQEAGSERYVPMGLLLSSSPGTGKTAFVTALLELSPDITFVQLKDVLSTYVGESEANLARLLGEAGGEDHIDPALTRTGRLSHMIVIPAIAPVGLDLEAFLGTPPGYPRSITDTLQEFLEPIGIKDVRAIGRVGNTLQFVIVPKWQEGLGKIKDALISAESPIADLGIDPRNIEIRDEIICIAIPVSEGGV